MFTSATTYDGRMVVNFTYDAGKQSDAAAHDYAGLVRDQLAAAARRA